MSSFLDGLSDLFETVTTTGTGTDAITPNYTDYVNRYPDLLNAYNSRGADSQNLTIEQWGQRHYETYGRNEGRNVASAGTRREVA